MRAPILAIACVSMPSLAQEDSDKENITWAVNTLSRCAAVYSIAADLFEANGDAAQAENSRGWSRGAAISAAYLLGQESISRGQDPRPYGFFSENYVDGIVESTRTELLAMMENDNLDDLTTELKKCQMTQELQVSLVQQMRDERINR